MPLPLPAGGGVPTFLSNAARNWTLVWRVSGSELLALWKGRKPRSPSPRPSPQRRGRTIGRVVTNRGIQAARATKRQSTLSLGARPSPTLAYRAHPQPQGCSKVGPGHSKPEI